MPNSITPSKIERYKREAKQLSRTNSITHSQALDRIAISNGFNNWSLLMKHSNASDHRKSDIELLDKSSRPALFHFSRSPEEMRRALYKVKQPKEWHLSRTDEAVRQTEDICSRFESAENAVDFAIDYMTCLLTVPRFSIQGETTVYIEMRRWLPYHMQSAGSGTQVLVNREYKPVGLKSKDWVKYEEFRHLHSHLNSDQLKAFAWHPDSPGYLYVVSPWSSRQNAKEYLERLYILKAELAASE